MLSKWEKWIHEETSDMVVLLTLFGSNAGVVRLQSVNAALTWFQHMTDSRFSALFYLFMIRYLLFVLYITVDLCVYFYNYEQHIAKKFVVFWLVCCLWSLPPLGPKVNVI